jgi:hypothetical protein
MGRREGSGPLVRSLGFDLGVEDLDDVHGARRAQPRQHPAQAGPARVERVRGVDQAALGPYPGDDLGHGQHVRHPFGEEQADDVAVGCPDLLPDDDPDAQVASCRGGRDLVVVGDEHHVQAFLGGALG